MTIEGFSRVDGAVVDENSLLTLPESTFKISATSPVVAENNPNFHTDTIPSFLEKEEELLTGALNDMVVKDLSSATSETGIIETDFNRRGGDVSLRSNTGLLTEKSDVLTQGSVPLLIDLPTDELEFVANRFLRQLNEILAASDRSYGLLQIQGKDKIELPRVIENAPLYRYTLDLFIVEKKKVFSHDIKVVVDLQTPVTTGTRLVVRQARIVVGDPLDLLPGHKVPMGYLGHDTSRKLGHNQSTLADLGGVLIGSEDLRIEEERQRRTQKSSQEFRCFGLDDSSVDVGFKGIKSQEECAEAGGRWDRPVEDDKECPFYKANRNYENNRGGTRGTGFCEVPLGAKLVGFRNITADPDFQPLCYNCKDRKNSTVTGLGRCCAEQATDLEKYPLLTSPDYAFAGDEADRGQAKQNNQLTSRGLNSDRTPLAKKLFLQ